MKFVAAVIAASMLAVAGATTIGGASRCQTGEVRGFATISGDRFSGVGGISSRFDTAQRLFTQRYNCAGNLVKVRRVDDGIYEIWFPNNPSRSPVASAVNGAYASITRIDSGVFRVQIFGPDIDGNHLIPRDIPFAVQLV